MTDEDVKERRRKAWADYFSTLEEGEEEEKSISYLYLAEKIRGAVEDFRDPSKERPTFMTLSLEFEKIGETVLCHQIIANFKGEA